MYIIFILNFQKVQANYQILLKRAQTSVILIVFNGVLYAKSRKTGLKGIYWPTLLEKLQKG
jgi:hypothetical protein